VGQPRPEERSHTQLPLQDFRLLLQFLGRTLMEVAIVDDIDAMRRRQRRRRRGLPSGDGWGKQRRSTWKFAGKAVQDARRRGSGPQRNRRHGGVGGEGPCGLPLIPIETAARPTPSASAKAFLAQVGLMTPSAVMAALRYFIGIGAFANSFQNPQLCSVWKACAVMSSTFPPSAKLSTPLLEP
jgi:hypothetical protein